MTLAPAPLLSAVVPCMGRLHHLRQSLPALLRVPGLEVVLVDYACPDESGAYAREHWPAVRVVEVRGPQHFNKPKALNAGLAVAQGEWIAIVDADMVVAPDFGEVVRAELAPGVFVGRADERNGTGFVVARRDDLVAVGGYDERMEGWGYEDDDLRRRLFDRGLRLRRAPAGLLTVVDHPEEERTRHYAEKDRRSSALFNEALVWQARYRDVFHDPERWPRRLVVGPGGPGLGDVWLAATSALHAATELGLEVCLYGRVHAATLARPAARSLFLQASHELPFQWDREALASRALLGRATELREALDLLDGGDALEVVDDVGPSGGAAFRVAPLFPFPPRHWLRGARVLPQPRREGRQGLRLAHHLERPDTLTELLRLGLFEAPVALPVGDGLRACAQAVVEADVVVVDGAELLPLCASLGTPTFVVGLAEGHPEAQGHHATNLLFCADLPALEARLRRFWGLGLTPASVL